MITQAPKGTRDIFGDEMRVWQRVEALIRDITAQYNFHEIRTPMFEHTELFLRGVGETTDVVQKEMYTFTDKGGRSISLRPELTAGVARAYVENGLHVRPQPTKLCYIGPNFRYEKPQAGRYRQHYQFGVEVFGAGGAAAEAEIISLGYTLLSRLGINEVRLNINSIGCPECRAVYQQRLKDFLGENFNHLCPTCQQRFEKNPLRVLDCKIPACKTLLQNAPSVLDALDDGCRTHFESLQTLLTAMGIPFTINPKVVRGLDYYTRTVFEFIDHDGAGLTVIGGGRYDRLIAEVGGAPTCAVGFGMGMDRLVLLLQAQAAADAVDAPEVDLFVGYSGGAGFQKAQALVYALRQAGVRAESDLLERSVKAQLKFADKLNARFSTVIGEDEINNNESEIRDMRGGGRVKASLNDMDKLMAIIK